MQFASLLPDIITIAEAASKKVLEIYRTDFKVEYQS
jgi:3'(2'), 5'-bisphosphate nucleotidase